ncbi:DMATS type aromatic prenyltransferase [Saccharothrix coeruleofusca]|uniref:tryptophan dimethylallyltransferase family protein n=1 Tax=Saccharothrix coeruleofusca TaxID=33919 RepID=UPI001AE7A9B9|nr:tryptophan dimethylallyltransferase family protein [Saccharothrix coeruleofusca]MBP2337499.1 DMATS type aromatic prenyltransferase [Saccharothrix coeruleofusca]
MFDAIDFRHRSTPDSDSLGTLVRGQFAALAEAAGLTGPREELEHLGDAMLGPSAALPVRAPGWWYSEVSDDHSPVEYSLSFEPGLPPQLRLLAEPNGIPPGVRENVAVGRRVLHGLAERYGFDLRRFALIEDLFLPDRPQGAFGLWCAVVLTPHGEPSFKVYLDPGAQGTGRAPELVEEGLARLGFHRARPLVGDAVADGGRLMYFALDLGQWSRPRVKVYFAHDGGGPEDAARAASAVQGSSGAAVEEFCRTVAGPGPFAMRPLVSCYSLVDAEPEPPDGYTVHVPIRDYVEHDGEARARAVAVMHRQGHDPAVLDRALAAVTRRRLDAGVGLISYLSQVFTPRAQRLTAYLSAEANQVRPPRTRVPHAVSGR